MKHQPLNITTARLLPAAWLTSLLAMGCRKEKMPAPSRLDENYFVVQDNPNDAVDHARYEFYKSTGIASFYNDTIHRKQVGEIDGKPRYTYFTLSMEYSLYERILISYKLVSDRTQIPAFLDLLKQDLLPRLPANLRVPSFLMMDSLWNAGFPAQNVQIADGWTTFQGFNTIGICVKNIAAMSGEEKKIIYCFHAGGYCGKTIERSEPGKIAAGILQYFEGCSKINNAGIGYLFRRSLHVCIPSGMEPAAHTLGILKYPRVKLGEAPPMNNLVSMPRTADDLRAFLTAALCYTAEEFTNLYPNNALLLKKFNVIRNIVREAGFKLPG